MSFWTSSRSFTEHSVFVIYNVIVMILHVKLRNFAQSTCFVDSIPIHFQNKNVHVVMDTKRGISCMEKFNTFRIVVTGWPFGKFLIVHSQKRLEMHFPKKQDLSGRWQPSSMSLPGPISWIPAYCNHIQTEDQACHFPCSFLPVPKKLSLFFFGKFEIFQKYVHLSFLLNWIRASNKTTYKVYL